MLDTRNWINNDGKSEILSTKQIWNLGFLIVLLKLTWLIVELFNKGALCTCRIFKVLSEPTSPPFIIKMLYVLCVFRLEKA
jgi:hypothetical protein